MFLLRTACKDLRQRMRDPLSMALWIGIPLGIGTMMNLAFGGQGGGTPTAEVLVVDQDGTFVSEFLLRSMGSAQGGDGARLPFVAEEVGLEEGRARIEDGDGTALLVIPAGFSRAVLREEPCTLELVTNPAQRILPGMVEETLELLVEAVHYAHRIFGAPIRRLTEIVDSGREDPTDVEVAEIAVLVNGVVASVEDLLFPPAIELESEPVPEGAGEGQGLTLGALFFPSMLFMALFFMAQGLSEDLWLERERGTLRRALVSPHGAGTFLGGKLLAGAVLISGVAFVGLLAGRFLFGIPLEDLPLAALWAAVSGAFLMLLMVPLQLLASSQRAGSLLTNLVMMPLLMLGGSFFPFEVMPEGLAAIGRLTPNGWALAAFKAIVRGEAATGVVLPSLAVLVAVGALLFLVSVRRLAGGFGRG